jgi:hypothetical protein
MLNRLALLYISLWIYVKNEEILIDLKNAVLLYKIVDNFNAM